MSHIRFDPTHEPEPTSHSHFQMPRVWQKSHQDAEAFPLNEPIDREFGSQSSLSVIVPAKNEASSLPRLVSEIILALRPLCTMSSKPIPRRLSRFEIIADFRGRLTCLFPTQLRPLMRRFFLVFLGCEHGNLGVV